MARPRTLGELKKSGWRSRGVKAEMRENLIARLKAKQPVFEGIIGYEQTVIPQIHNAILSGHDFILLGLRGQAKTRILRSLTELLDEEMPAIEGSELNEDPFHPISAPSIARADPRVTCRRARRSRSRAARKPSGASRAPRGAARARTSRTRARPPRASARTDGTSTERR